MEVVSGSCSPEENPAALRAAILYHYRRPGGNFAIHVVDNFARAAGENFTARQGNFVCEHSPHIFPAKFKSPVNGDDRISPT